MITKDQLHATIHEALVDPTANFEPRVGPLSDALLDLVRQEPNIAVAITSLIDALGVILAETANATTSNERRLRDMIEEGADLVRTQLVARAHIENGLWKAQADVN